MAEGLFDALRADRGRPRDDGPRAEAQPRAPRQLLRLTSQYSEIQKRLTDFAGTDTQSEVIEANLFSDVPFPEADERAEALMGQLITEMRKERRMLLYSALEAQSSYHIEGDEFIINATDPASRNMLTEEHNLKVLNEAAFRLSGLKFKVTGGFAGGKTKHTAEDRVKLYELMGDKLRDKK